MFGKKCVMAAAAAVAMSLSQISGAAVVDFEGPTDLADNFVNANSGTVTQTNNGDGNDYIASATSGAVYLIYDTTPGDGETTRNLFSVTNGGPALTATVGAGKALTSGGANSSLAILFMDANDRSHSYVALLNLDNGSSGAGPEGSRFNTVGDANPLTGSLGTHVAGPNSGVNWGSISGVDAFVSPITFTYALDADGNAVMTVAFGTNSATSPVIAAEDAFDQVEIALRLGPTNGGAIWADNFNAEVVPEPTSLSFLGIAACGLLARRRVRGKMDVA